MSTVRNQLKRTSDRSDELEKVIVKCKKLRFCLTSYYCTVRFLFTCPNQRYLFLLTPKFTGKSQDTGDKGKAAESTSATTKVVIRQHYRLTMNINIKFSCHFDYDYTLQVRTSIVCVLFSSVLNSEQQLMAANERLKNTVDLLNDEIGRNF